MPSAPASAVVLGVVVAVLLNARSLNDGTLTHPADAAARPPARAH